MAAQSDYSNYYLITPNRVYVSKLPPSMTEIELQELFSNYGNVRNVNVLSDKGYGFVTFQTSEEANRLIRDVKSVMWNGRRLTIAPARTNQPARRASYDNEYYVLRPVSENGVNYIRYKNMAYFQTPPPLPPSPDPVYENGVHYFRHKGTAYFYNPQNTTTSLPFDGVNTYYPGPQMVYFINAPPAAPNSGLPLMNGH